LEHLDARLFSNLLWPVRGGRDTRPFHRRRHGGLDIEAELGSAVRAAADGRVVYAGKGLPGLGRSIVLLHKSGWVTVYGSNRELHVRAGDEVRRGEWIAEVGRSGSTGDAHLHFELREGGDRRDPSPLLVQVPEHIDL
jgi:lipoprotein NlpD